MRKTVPVVLTLLVALAAVTVPLPTGAKDAAPQMVFFDGDGLRLGPAPDASQPECGGVAPAETYCDTGLHAGTFTNSVGVGTSGTATLEVRLYHAQATLPLIVQVNYIDGEYAGGAVYGIFPTVNVFWHECYSYELGTAQENGNPLPFEPNGTPGGSGTWACMVNYEP